jgi:FecR-like protein
MRTSFLQLAATIFAASCFISNTAIAETVGKTVSVRTIVTGANGELKRSDPVSRDEQIGTNNTGLGQFQFVDGTKLAIGPNATVVIDDFVLGDGNRFKKLTLNVSGGTLRWISGKSPSSAYAITTAAGVLGVRGTAFDLAVQGDTAVMVLLNGAAQWCLPRDSGTCVEVTRPCDFIIASHGNITQPQHVTGLAVKQLGADAFPFLISNKRLLPSFQLSRANCGLGFSRFASRSGSADNQDSPRSTPERGSKPGRPAGPPTDGCGPNCQ